MVQNCKFLLAFITIWLLLASSASGQDAKLVQAAKKEGGKAIAYGSLETETFEPVKKAFEKKTGLKVEYWRASATKVMDRALSEYRAGKPLYDIVITNRNPMNLMRDSGIFAKYDSPSWKAFTPDVMDRFFGPSYRYNVFGIIYNTRLVKPAEAPKSFEDLLKPQYKGKFVMPDPTQHTTTTQFLANLHKLMGKEKAEKFIRDIAATKPLFVESLLPAARRTTTGETPIALAYLKWVYMFARREGAPLDYVRQPSYLGEGHFLALGNKAPNPSTAKAFIDFFFSPVGMKIIAEEGEFVTLKGFHPPVPDSDKWKIIMADELTRDEFKKKKDEYKKIFFGS